MSHLAPQLVTAAERRLRHLVEANRLVMAELSLDLLLPRIVEAARHVIDAEYAALGVVGVDTLLEELGPPDPTSPPVAPVEGSDRGLLRALVGTPTAIRLPHLAADPRFCDIALANPDLSSFLAVPIGSGGSIFGTLYLANRKNAAEFSAEDEYLLTALAAAAGIAVGNAQRYAHVRRRQDWSQASAEVGHQLLARGSDTAVLDQIAESVARLADADSVQIALPVPDAEDTLEFAVSRGPGANQARGLRYPATGSIAWEAMHNRSGIVLADVQSRLREYSDARSQLPITNLMAFPLQGEGQPRGCVVVCRSNSKAFSAAEVEMARAFTNQAALALELAEARADRSRLGQLEDRDRISRDLSQHVLQKLFSASLTVQGAATLSVNPAVRAQLGSTISTLDDTIRGLRASIFGLQTSQATLAAVGHRVVTTIAQLTPALGFAPAFQLTGPLDTTVDQGLVTELEIVLREVLGAIARQSTTRAATVLVSADPTGLALSVDDDGSDEGVRPDTLGDLARRAEQRGAHLAVDISSTGGTRIRWAAPLSGQRKA